MEIKTFDETLKTFKNRRPFRPFAVALVNGSRFEIDHPDALVVRRGVGLYIGPEGVPVVFDHEGVSQVIGDLMGQENPS